MVSLAQQLTLLVPALLLALPLGMVSAGTAAAQSPSASAAALALRSATPDKDRRRLDQPFTDAARSEWHYTPRSRSGIPWKDMSAAQRDAARSLLRSALTEPGLLKVQAVMALEIALRELETFGFSRDPENYALALFGTPAATPPAATAPTAEGGTAEGGTAKPKDAWGWRLEGHHLSLHFTLLGDRYVSTLPQFLGANPARVPHDIAKGGPRQGTRVLAQEEDLARQLLESLSPAALEACHFEQRTYGDIVSKNAAQLSPLSPVGVRWAQLPAAQQAQLLKLITAFAEHLRPELVEQRLARVRAGGLETLRFGWAGSVQRGQPFYFRIQGARILIELDNSGGNHIHSVWRDFNGDWGRDTLAEHYRGAAAGGHTHGSH